MEELLFEDLTNKQKAAILFISLGVDSSAELYKHMNEEEISDITVAISQVTHVNKETRDAVVEEFYNLCIAQQYILDGGVDYARGILYRAMGAEEADRLMDQLATNMRMKPFEFVKRANSAQLLNLLHNEHPQTIALVLSHMQPRQAAEIVASLPSSVQADIIGRIAKMGSTSADYVREAERVLERKVLSMSISDSETVGGIPTIVEIINSLDRPSEKAILEILERDDMDLADEIRKKLFVFEDIAKMDRQAVQRVLREVTNADLAPALKVANEDVKATILNNLSKRAAAMLQDDISVMGAIRLRDAEEAQQRIVAIIRTLEESGEIVIARGGGDELV